MGKNVGKKISLAKLKEMRSKNEQKEPEVRRRGRSRERRDPSLASRGSSCSSGYDDGPMDVEAVFEALHSCRDLDDVLLSTTLFEQGILPEHMEWATKAFEAMQRKKEKKNARKKNSKK